MAWTQEDADTLKRAIATGARKVRFSHGGEAEYRDLDHMLKTLQLIQEEVTPSAARERCTYASYAKD